MSPAAEKAVSTFAEHGLTIAGVIVTATLVAFVAARALGGKSKAAREAIFSLVFLAVIIGGFTFVLGGLGR